jgi:hypothetical protein
MRGVIAATYQNLRPLMAHSLKLSIATSSNVRAVCSPNYVLAGVVAKAGIYTARSSQRSLLYTHRHPRCLVVLHLLHRLHRLPAKQVATIKVSQKSMVTPNNFISSSSSMDQIIQVSNHRCYLSASLISLLLGSSCRALWNAAAAPS